MTRGVGVGVACVLAGSVALAPACGGAAHESATWRPALGPPRVGAQGNVVWAPEAVAFSAAGARLARSLAAGTAADSLRGWEEAARDSALRPFALRSLALARLARGDSVAADAALAELVRANSIWTWEAVRTRADLALARAGPAAADSLLEGVDRAAWPDLERAAWLLRRSDLGLALRDTARGIDLARQAVLRYPSLAPASRALASLERVLEARGERLEPAVLRASAEVAFFRGDRSDAARRLARAWPELGGDSSWRAAVRLAEIQRLDRRHESARHTLEAVAARATGGEAAFAVALERARVLRDSRAGRAALDAYVRAATAAPDTARLEAAWWELEREAEDQEDRDLARRTAERVAALGGRRAAEASVRAGLLAFEAGDVDQALRAWQVPGPAAAFWRGVALRAQGRAEGDSLLARLAGEAGYLFYRAAARETLGVRGGPWRVAAAAPPVRALVLAADLVGLGASDDAMRVLGRWGAGDPRLGAPAEPPVAQLLSAAQVAYAAGRYPTGIQLARRALERAGEGPDGRDVVPWIYPPAWDSLFVAAGGEVVAPGGTDGGIVDRPLLQALAWQESKFDPRARSRSDALGLLQLKLATAGDVRRPGEAPLDAEALFDPARNLELGRRYLSRMLQRFGGRTYLALAAYNAGPTAARRWDRPLPRGGAAMAIERIGFGAAQEYAKIVLAVRQAYRELRPAPR